ncbi:MAG TPA: NADH-quinone oxidoreductase subunit NuoH [Blastocatellia bacterium]|jgi:NADH-quinone oxidoreductase subunit H|nr:NADH-quinone oxidoreductase subunit NuoH [Blastocatellia bacterium]HAF23615.1 NADH-quinone oxidoreductase subunit NuoH [Blastocatellia bacterium]
MIAFFAPINFVDQFLLKFFSANAVNYVVWPFIQVAVVVTLVTTWVAAANYLERKISAFMQARLGPMRVGPWGILQPIADGIKLLTKEDFIPEKADRWIFLFAPYIAIAAAFVVFVVIPFGPDWAVITDINIGLLFVLAVSSVGVLALILAGWSSNSKYSLLGALRSSAQMISYEVAMGLSLIGALMFARTLSLSGVVNAQASDSIWFLFYQPLGFLIFLISGIAENNRAPFDLPEAESELVAGFHTEYSGFRWSLFFMAEYGAMVVVSAMATTVYLGGWYFPFIHRLEANGYHNLYVIVSLLVFLLKLAVILYLYFWLRWTLPRFRYDQLMDIGWKWLIPSALINITLSALAIFLVQALNGWHGIKTIDSLSAGLNLTGTGKALMIVLGLAGLGITGLLLARINWRSRDFNLKSQRRNIRLVNLPQGKPAVPAVAPAASE